MQAVPVTVDLAPHGQFVKEIRFAEQMEVVMQLLTGDDARSHVNDLVHFDTQRADRGLDLTVDAVFQLTGAGQLDFGGSEFKPAPRTKLDPQRAHPDDDYGWWTLDPGTYVVRYNETPALDDDLVGQVVPLPRLLQAGLHHGSFVVDASADAPETALFVGPTGGRLKENCRISRLLIFSTS
jgi:deoxycytidine triphosphate deaminase